MGKENVTTTPFGELIIKVTAGLGAIVPGNWISGAILESLCSMSRRAALVVALSNQAISTMSGPDLVGTIQLIPGYVKRLVEGECREARNLLGLGSFASVMIAGLLVAGSLKRMLGDEGEAAPAWEGAWLAQVGLLVSSGCAVLIPQLVHLGLEWSGDGNPASFVPWAAAGIGLIRLVGESNRFRPEMQRALGVMWEGMGVSWELISRAGMYTARGVFGPHRFVEGPTRVDGHDHVTRYQLT